MERPGVSKNKQTLPGGCDLLVTPDILILNGIRGQLTVQVPNQNSLIGARFYMQRRAYVQDRLRDLRERS